MNSFSTVYVSHLSFIVSSQKIFSVRTPDVRYNYFIPTPPVTHYTDCIQAIRVLKILLESKEQQQQQ